MVKGIKKLQTYNYKISHRDEQKILKMEKIAHINKKLWEKISCIKIKRARLSSQINCHQVRGLPECIELMLQGLDKL